MSMGGWLSARLSQHLRADVAVSPNFARLFRQSNPPELAEDRQREEMLLEASGMNDPNYKFDPSPRLRTPQEIASINRS